MTSTLSRIQADSHHVGDVARMSNEWTAAEEALSKLARDAAGGTRHNEVCAERTFGLEGKGWDGKAIHWRCLMGGHATAGQIFDNDSIEPAGHDIGCTEPKLVQLEAKLESWHCRRHTVRGARSSADPRPPRSVRHVRSSDPYSNSGRHCRTCRLGAVGFVGGEWEPDNKFIIVPPPGKGFPHGGTA